MTILSHCYLCLHQQTRKHLHHAPNDAVRSRPAPLGSAGENVHASCSDWGQHVSGGGIAEAAGITFWKGSVRTNLAPPTLPHPLTPVLQCTTCGKRACFASQTPTSTKWHLSTWLHPLATQKWCDICWETRCEIALLNWLTLTNFKSFTIKRTVNNLWVSAKKCIQL